MYPNGGSVFVETFVDVFSSLSCAEAVDHLLVELRYPGYIIPTFSIYLSCT